MKLTDKVDVEKEKNMMSCKWMHDRCLSTRTHLYLFLDVHRMVPLANGSCVWIPDRSIGHRVVK